MAPESHASKRTKTAKRTDAPTTLCLLRHGDAGDASPVRRRDAARELTAKGRRQARWAGKSLARLGLVPSGVWSGTLRRARETAKLAARAARSGVVPVETAALDPHADPAAIVRLVVATTARRAPRADRGGDVVVLWVVGHEPYLSRLLHHLTGAPPGGLRFGKGAVAVVEGPHGLTPGACSLAALLPPAAVREIRRRAR